MNILKTIVLSLFLFACTDTEKLSPAGDSVSLRKPTLLVDPGFSRERMPNKALLWYNRMWAALNNNDQILNLTKYAGSNDTYLYGRTLGDHITALLHVLRVTGDPAVLDEIDRLTELMRIQLQDWSIISDKGSDYVEDGFLNWQNKYDPEWYGTDTMPMDEMLAHSQVAAFTYAFYVNRDFDARFAEHYDFWIDYLINHFEAKWRKRNDVPVGNFLVKDLTHVYAAWLRYNYYVYKLTGDQQYLTDAEHMADMLKSHMIEVDNGNAYVWDHRMTELENGAPWGCQPFYYARGTMQYLIDLSLEGFSVFDDAYMTKLAGTVSHNIIDNGPVDFASDVCGGIDLGGLSASGYPRETQKRWSGTSGYVEIGAWDKSGKILETTVEVYNDVERDHERPRYILNPAGMVFSILYKSKTY